MPSSAASALSRRPLVLLESGRIAVASENKEEHLLMPKVKVFFNARSETCIPPREVDLASALGLGGADRIVGLEDPAKWNVDPFHIVGLT